MNGFSIGEELGLIHVVASYHDKIVQEHGKSLVGGFQIFHVRYSLLEKENAAFGDVVLKAAQDLVHLVNETEFGVAFFSYVINGFPFGSGVKTELSRLDPSWGLENHDFSVLR